MSCLPSEILIMEPKWHTTVRLEMTPLLILIQFFVALSCAIAVPYTRSNVSTAQPQPLVGSGILRLPLTKVNATALVKRQTGIPLNNPSHGVAYMVTVGFGTPPQFLTLALDTGISDTWVDPQCSYASDNAFCTEFFTPWYNNIYSTTSINMLVFTPTVSYTKDYPVTISGIWWQDNLNVAGRTITKQQFGYITKSTGLNTHLLGVGMGTGPGPKQMTYNGFIDSLFLQGVTSSRAFSLDLANVDTSSGSIIFGGIDTGKYSGSLGLVKIVPYYTIPDLSSAYYVYVTSVGMTATSGSTTWTTAGYTELVVLDSGRTFSYLPQTLVTSMLTGFTGVLSKGNGKYTIPCTYIGDTTTTVDFSFGGVTIRVPIHQFMYFDGTQCWFGAVANTAGGLSYLGDTFLRAAYVVYDQDNMNIWMAQATSCGTNLVAIGSGVNAVPSRTGDCQPLYTTASTSTLTKPTSTTSVPPSQTVYVTVTAYVTVTSTSLSISTSISTVAKTTVTKSTTSNITKTTTATTTKTTLKTTTLKCT